VQPSLRPCGVAADMDVTVGKRIIELDGLVLHTILHFCSADARDLKAVACVSSTCRAAAGEVAADALLAVLNQLAVLPLPAKQRLANASRIVQLGAWTAVEACTVMWLRAAPNTLKLLPGRRVSRWEDISGNGNHAFARRGERAPEFVADAFGSPEGDHGALEFTGRSMLATLPFDTPLPQPLTLMLVARARGDVTLCDALTERSSRFELCHGYPTADVVSRSAPQVCMTAHGSGDVAPGAPHLLRGHTRSTGSWHVYTAVYDGDKSELYIDGLLEARGKSVGKASLDGVRLGCDHTGTFHLKGAIAEVRLFSCHLAPSPRAQIEAAMALRYGLVPAGVMPPPPEKVERVGCIRLRRATSA